MSPVTEGGKQWKNKKPEEFLEDSRGDIQIC